MNAVERILADLSPNDRAQLEDVMVALHEVRTKDHGPGDELFNPDGMTRLLNEVSPAVKNKLFQLHQLTDEKRSAPYQPKMGIPEWADTLSLDADTMEKVKSTLDAGDVAYKLADRMGGSDTPGKVHDSAMRRQAITDAFEADQPLAARRAFAEHAIRTANPGLSIRDTLGALIDHEESRS